MLKLCEVMLIKKTTLLFSKKRNVDKCRLIINLQKFTNIGFLFVFSFKNHKKQGYPLFNTCYEED